MPQIIASVYEIEKEIGSGGGGIVYLAKHLRLNKEVVLKADKRELRTAPEELRREVDILKNLSHTYIPQVYDFIVENGVVYTVEDYVPGESMDKCLKQGIRFSQVQIIEWACELLEALCYLHSRPPYGILHGDIKPANVMVRPDGGICLIDYNIALFLGEDGAVKLGSSSGYASPEHYGIDFSHAAETKLGRASSRTVYSADPAKTVYSGDTSRHSGVLLDVRSDIYSLGATLYHLLTGRRPPQKAEDVEPIAAPEVSRAVADIVTKAMNPNPDLRYQTAEEMLYAFEHLYDEDLRVRRHKRRGLLLAAALCAVLLLGGLATYLGLSQMETLQRKRVLAEYSANALEEGRRAAALDYAAQALPGEGTVFEEPLLPAAQKALTDALGVYQLADGFYADRVIALPAELFALRMSPDGEKIAAVYAYEAAVYDLASGGLLFTCPLEQSALSEVEFIDSDTLAVAAAGGLSVCDAASGSVRWTGNAATGLAVSADGSTVAAVYKDSGECYVYAADTGELRAVIDFGGRGQSVVYNDIFANPGGNLFALNGDGSMLAASFSDGSVEVYPVDAPEDSLILMEEGKYQQFEGGFYGQYFVFSASDETESVCYVADLEAMAMLGSFTLPSHIGVETDESGVYICNENTLVRMDPATVEQTEIAYSLSEMKAYMRTEDYTAVLTEDGTVEIFTPEAIRQQTLDGLGEQDFVCVSDGYLCVGSGSSANLRILKRESHEDALLASYDAAYQHSEARVSTDYSTVMLYDFSQFLVLDMQGKTLAEQELPRSDEVYDQQYLRTEEGDFLEVTYYDGSVTGYSAADGSVAYTDQAEEPDRTLYEEFYTEDYRIARKLNGAPEVYDRASGEKRMELQSDDYLAYVTEVGDYLITEYTTAAGERYGLLLNRECEELAYLPMLCDIVYDPADPGGEVALVFDDGLGHLRQSRLYTAGELEQMAQ